MGFSLGVPAFFLSAVLLLTVAVTIADYAVQTIEEKFWGIIAAVMLQLGITSSITSLFSFLTSEAWLATQFLFLVFTIPVLKTRTNLFVSFQIILNKIKAQRLRLLSGLSSSSLIPLVTLLCILVFLTLSGLVQYLVPLSDPQYGDERMYHASRVMYWLQNQSIFPYTTHNDRQTVFVFGGELFFLWPMLFTRIEWIGRLIFWLGYPLCAVGLYLLLQALRAGKTVALIGVLLFVSTPIVVDYSVGLKPGMWLTLSVLGAAFWLIRAAQQPEHMQRNMFFSGLFLMLSVNVKSIALALLVPFFLLSWLIFPDRSIGSKLFFLILGFLTALLFSGLIFPFSFNVVRYGHILGPEAMRRVHSSDLSLYQIYVHLIRLPFLLFEFPTLPFAIMRDTLNSWGNYVIAQLGASVPLPLESDEGWPGQYRYVVSPYAVNFSLGGLIWLPFLIAGLLYTVKNIWRTLPNVNLSSVSLIVFLEIFFLGGIIFLVRWMPHSSLPERLLVAPYALGLTLSVRLFSEYFLKSKILIAFALALTIWHVYQPLQQQLKNAKFVINTPQDRSRLDWPFAEALGHYIRPGSRILFVGHQDAPDYPLFAPTDTTQNLLISWGKIPFDSARMEHIIAEYDISHVLIQNERVVDFHWDPSISTVDMVDWLTRQSDFNEVELLASEMRLFETTEHQHEREQKIDDYLQTLVVPEHNPLIFVNPTLKGQIGLGSYSLNDTRETEEFVLLTQDKSIHAQVWSMKKRLIRLAFEVASVSDTSRSSHTVQLSGIINGQSVYIEQTFVNSATLEFNAPLREGANTFYFDLVDNNLGDQSIKIYQIQVDPLP